MLCCLQPYLIDRLRPEQQRVRVLALAAVHQAQGAEGRTSGLGLAGGLDVGQALGCGGEGGKGHEDVWQALWCGGRGAGGDSRGWQVVWTQDRLGRECGEGGHVIRAEQWPQHGTGALPDIQSFTPSGLPRRTCARACVCLPHTRARVCPPHRQAHTPEHPAS